MAVMEQTGDAHHDRFQRVSHGGTFNANPYCAATGNAALIPPLIERSKPSVRIVLMGIPYLEPVEVSFASFPANEKEMFGSIASHYDDWEEAIRLVSEGVINLEDHVGEILPLESYAQAW